MTKQLLKEGWAKPQVVGKGDAEGIVTYADENDRDYFYVAGDFGVSKYDTTGKVVWEINQKADDIAVDKDGNIYITREEGRFPNRDVWVGKYSVDGKKVWDEEFGSNANDWTEGIAVDKNGNVYVTGFTDGFLGDRKKGDMLRTQWDAWVAKLNDKGKKQWSRQLSTISYEQSSDVAVDNDGNVYVTGYTGGKLPGNSYKGGNDGWLAKYDADGDDIWVKQFGTNGRDPSNAIAVDSQGNVYITGTTNASLAGGYRGSDDIYLAKYDSKGREQWIEQFGTRELDRSYDITVDSQDNVYVSGDTYGNLAGEYKGSLDAWVVGYDSQGKEQILKYQIGSESDERAYGLAVKALGGQQNVYLVGKSLVAEQKQECDTGLLHIDANFQDDDGDGVCEAEGTVKIGLKEGIKNMLRIENAKVKLDAESKSFEVVSGTVYSEIRNVEQPLFAGSFTINTDKPSASIDIKETNLKNDFTLAGLNVDFNKLSLNEKEIRLGYKLYLPDKLGRYKFNPWDASITTDESSNSLKTNGLYISKDGIKLGSSSKVEFQESIAFPIINRLDATAEKLSLSYDTPEKELKLQGDLEIELPKPNLLKNNSKSKNLSLTGSFSEDNYIKIKDGKVDVAGELKIGNKLQFKKFTIDDLAFKLNTEDNKVSATANINFNSKLTEKLKLSKAFAGEKDRGIKAEIGFKYKPNVELDSFKIEKPDIDVPIFPAIFLQKIGLGVENLAPSDENNTAYTATIGLSLGKELNKIKIPKFFKKFGIDDKPNSKKSSLRLVSLDITGESDFDSYVTGGIGLSIINDNILNLAAQGTYNWDKKTVTASGKFNVLNGFVAGEGKYEQDKNGNIKATFDGEMKFPDSKYFGFLRNQEIGEATVIFESSDDKNNNNDFLKVDGKYKLPFLGYKEFDVEYYFNKDEREAVQSEQELQNKNSFTIKSGTEKIVLSANWDNEVARVRVRLKKPDGTYIEEEDFKFTKNSKVNKVTVVEKLTNSNVKSIGLINPTSGQWEMEIVNEGKLENLSYSFMENVGSIVTPEISAGAILVNEENRGVKEYQFDVGLSEVTSEEVSVNYSTVDKTATGGSDYIQKSGNLIFKPGETQKTISIKVKGDTEVEDDEEFLLEFSNPINATISKGGSGIAIIQNDDVASEEPEKPEEPQEPEEPEDPEDPEEPDPGNNPGGGGSGGGGGVVITPGNTPPTLTDIDINAREDKSRRLRKGNFNKGFADADGDQLQTVKITALPTNGELKFNNQPVAANREIAIAQINKLRYHPNPNFNGKDSFEWNGSDGTDFAKTPATVNFNVRPANDRPTTTDFAKTIEEDTPLALTAQDFLNQFADADGDNLQKIKIFDLPKKGNLTDKDGNPVKRRGEYAVGSEGETLFTFTPKPNAQGTLQFQWQGSDGKKYGKRAEVEIDITPVNDIPTVADINKRGLEDRTVRFGPRNFSNKFADADRRDKLETIKITTLPTNGELKFDNEPVAANQKIAIADIKKLKYRANPDFHGEDSFQWNGSDGTAYAETPASVNLTIQPVSDRPTVTLTDTDIQLKAGDGEQTIPAFASFNPGISEGDQTLERYQIKVLKHGQIFAAPPTLDGDGNLKFTPVEQLEVKAGGSDTAKIAAFAIDSGDKKNRGQNRSLPVYFNIAVKPGENNDNLQGSKKNDTIDGDGGNDKIIGHSGSDLLIGGDGNDTLTGANNNDTLDGGLGNDELVGGSGDDSLLGGEGSDRLNGSSGSDTLIGGGGDDVIIGAAGEDLIALTPDWGNDTIHKFEDGIDKIKLPDGVGFSDLTITKDGPHTLISLGDNGLSLRRLKIDIIDETDFAA